MLSNKISKIKNHHLLSVAFITSVIATSASLYLSNVMGLVPCRLCWYQRILMYPLVLVLLDDLRHEHVQPKTIIFSVIGAGIALYHSILQITSTSCSVGGSCASILLQVGGVFTIPNLSLIAFIIISLCSIIVYQKQTSENQLE
jgi:disulfide bond formation protein DsbB